MVGEDFPCGEEANGLFRVFSGIFRERRRQLAKKRRSPPRFLNKSLRDADMRVRRPRPLTNVAHCQLHPMRRIISPYTSCLYGGTAMHLSTRTILVLLLVLGVTTPDSSGSSNPIHAIPQQAATAPDHTNGQEASSPNPDASGRYHLGNGVSPPQVIYSVDPEMTDKARQKKLSGTCVVSMIVDISGTPQNVEIAKSIATTAAPKLQPVARGLDLNCVKAAKQYRFKPATYKGKPIPVQIKVEINYRIY